MSETPRTDAALKKCCLDKDVSIVVLAKQMERELQALQKKCDYLQGRVDYYGNAAMLEANRP